MNKETVSATVTPPAWMVETTFYSDRSPAAEEFDTRANGHGLDGLSHIVFLSCWKDIVRNE